MRSIATTTPSASALDERAARRLERREARQKEATALIAYHWQKRVARARRIVGYALDAVDVDDDGNCPPEWAKAKNFKRRLRAATDARRETRNAPYYLTAAAKVAEAADRIEAARAGSTPVTLNIGAINIVRPPQYEEIDVEGVPVIDVEEVKK